ncbi:MAG TPA: ribosome-associated translation inhibitor RaiA [Bryobacteraceae bacterium]|nr:ribosome-associated translation inhibitor RaiA [Bryobacteraceae bacterium]
MKVIYTGKQRELTPVLQKKLDAKFDKLSKMLERKGEKEAHVMMSAVRHLHHAEITLNVYDHTLAGIGSDADEFTAICEAIDKLAKQVVKLRTKWRDTHRGQKDNWEKGAEQEEVTEVAARDDGKKPPRRVYRVNHRGDRKPMTLEEAVLEMEDEQDYLVYRDADKDCVSVLVRRRDGHFDLIES